MKTATVVASLTLLLVVVVLPLANAFSLTTVPSRSTKHLHLASNKVNEFKTTSYSTNRKKKLLDDTTSAAKSKEKIKTSVDPKKPKYKPRELARSFFGNPYFYTSKSPEIRQQLANEYESDRENSFGNKTVKDVFDQLKSSSDVLTAFEKLGVDRTKVIPYWKVSLDKRTPEDILNGKILVVDEDDEIITINKRYVQLSTFDIHATIPRDERAKNIRFVMGPSGSGKTFCAVKIAALEGIVGERKHVTVYFNFRDQWKENLKKSSYVVDEVKGKLQNELLGKWNYQQNKTLNLSLCIVLDEAGAAGLNGCFESKAYITELYQKFLSLAETVRLVVCGTGLVANAFGTGTDALKYRMKPWKTEDLKAVNERHFRLVQGTLDSLQLHPNLQALTTNARAAWYLLARIKSFQDENDANANFKQQQIYSYVPYIVRGVVSDYINRNRIKHLYDQQRRRVAAALFDIIENKEIKVPDEFPGLSRINNEDEQDVARSLLSINVEISSNGKATLVQGEGRPLSISPALTLVLYWMCGVPIPILSGWKKHEYMNALYECSRFMRACVRDYHNNVTNLTEYDARLFSLELIELTDAMPGPKANKTFYIPFLTGGTIWINKNLVPYADVVAPHVLYQSNSGESKSNPVSIKLLDELGKCGLVKNSSMFPDADQQKWNDIGWAITKSLDHVWQLKIDSNELSSDLDSNTKTRFFYPGKQILWPPPAMECKNATLYYFKSKWFLRIPNGKEKRPVNISSIQELSSDLTFYVSCNRNKIILKRVTRSGGRKSTHSLTISEECLDDSGNVMEGSLSGQDLKEWQYYQSVLRDKVKIRFLLS